MSGRLKLFFFNIVSMCICSSDNKIWKHALIFEAFVPICGYITWTTRNKQFFLAFPPG